MKLVFRLVLVLVVALAAACAPAAIASAHTLKIDGDMQALLHVNPNDAPVSGGSSALVMFFNDTTNRFSISNCVCKIRVQENSKVISTLTIPTRYATTSENPYIFPNPDVYTIYVTGEPKQQGDFQPFALTYIVRVTPGPEYMRNQTIARLVAIGFGLLVVLGVALVLYLVLSRKRSRKEKE